MNANILDKFSLNKHNFNCSLAVFIFLALFSTPSLCNLVLSAANESSNTLIRSQRTHYTVRVGDTLVIPCEIENRRQATVIWQYSKSRIPETLTVGYFYYRKDFRIRVIANTTQDKEQSWNLEIRKVRLEDEGYYLCKVMAEESLKRVVYLRVEIDLKLYPMNPIVNMDQQFNLICNTSYIPIEIQSKPTSTKSLAHQQHSHPRIVWYKDGEYIPHPPTSAAVDHTTLPSNQTTNTNFRIEYHSKPFVWSIIHFKSISSANIGTYTCKFRHQNFSTTLKYPNALNRMLLEMGFNESTSSIKQNKWSLIISLIFLIISII